MIPTRSGNRRVYRNNANVAGRSTGTVENARNAKSFEQWTPELDHVASNAAWAGGCTSSTILGLYVFGANERSCPTNMHNTVLAVNSAHKIRFAQDLALYNLTLS